MSATIHTPHGLIRLSDHVIQRAMERFGATTQHAAIMRLNTEMARKPRWVRHCEDGRRVLVKTSRAVLIFDAATDESGALILVTVLAPRWTIRNSASASTPSATTIRGAEQPLEIEQSA